MSLCKSYIDVLTPQYFRIQANTFGEKVFKEVTELK